MVKVTVKRVVHNPRDRVWRLFSDLSLVMEYHPHVKDVQLTSPSITSSLSSSSSRSITTTKKRPGAGIGASRICHFFDGTSTKEEVVQLLAKDYLVWKVKQLEPGAFLEEGVSVTTGDDDDGYSDSFFSFLSPPPNTIAVREMTVKYSAIALSPTRTEIRIDADFVLPPAGGSAGPGVAAATTGVTLTPSSSPSTSYYHNNHNNNNTSTITPTCFDFRFLRRLRIKRKISKNFASILRGMDYFLITGERVEKNVSR